MPKTIKQLRIELLQLAGDPLIARKTLHEELHRWYQETCHLPPPKDSQEKLILQRAIDRLKNAKQPD